MAAMATLMCTAMAIGGRAASGILALDKNALSVKAPDKVYLDAITRAGNRLVAAGEHGVIVYSDDSGRHWRQASVPVDATLTALAFATPLSGWAVGNSGVILHTADGGVSWQLQLTGAQANQLTLEAAQNIQPDNRASVGAPNALHRAHVLSANGASIPFLSLLLLSGNQVIAFGADRMAMRSDDGGQNWTDWSLRVGDPVSHHLYGCAVIGQDIYLVSEAGLVFRSTDNGQTFPAVTPAKNGTLFGVTATGDGMLVYGVAGLAYKSIDKGATWQQINIPTGANLMAALTVGAGDILLADEAGSFFLSQDHANSFAPLRAALPMAVFAAAQAPDGDIVAAGNRGIMTIPAQALAPR